MPRDDVPVLSDQQDADRPLVAGVDRASRPRSCAPTKVVNNEFLARGGVSAIPDPNLATRADRLDVERLGRESVLLEREAVLGQEPELRVSRLTNARGLRLATPLTQDAIDVALEQVERDLVNEGLLDRVGGEVPEEEKSRLSFEET